MKTVSDAVLLTTAQIAATLIGLLLVGVFFYLQSGFRRVSAREPGAEPFLRATTKLIVSLYGLVLGVALGLVALEPLWITLLYAVLSLAVLAAMLEWTIRSRAVSPAFRRAVRVKPLFAWPFLIVPLAVPWALDGWPLGREALVSVLLFGGGVAFLNTADLVLLAFDLASIERTVEGEDPRGADRLHGGSGASARPR